MSVNILTKRHSEFLSLKIGCSGSPVSTDDKMPHCWESHATALFLYAEQILVKAKRIFS